MLKKYTLDDRPLDDKAECLKDREILGRAFLTPDLRNFYTSRQMSVIAPGRTLALFCIIFDVEATETGPPLPPFQILHSD